jgi:hypothetical protein
MRVFSDPQPALRESTQIDDPGKLTQADNQIKASAPSTNSHGNLANTTEVMIYLVADTGTDLEYPPVNSPKKTVQSAQRPSSTHDSPKILKIFYCSL